jgi:hypothetical protein
MKTRAALLAAKRQQLLAESRVRRADIALQLQPLAHSLTSLDAGLRIVKRISKHPGWIAAVALGIAALKPSRLSSFFRAGTAGLRTWRQIRPVVQQLMALRD